MMAEKQHSKSGNWISYLNSRSISALFPLFSLSPDGVQSQGAGQDPYYPTTLTQRLVTFTAKA